MQNDYFLLALIIFLAGLSQIGALLMSGKNFKKLEKSDIGMLASGIFCIVTSLLNLLGYW